MSPNRATVVVAILCLSASLGRSAFAGETDALARQFVELLRYGQQYDDLHVQCLANAKRIPPESLLAGEPDKFYGIKPGSKCWPRVVKAYEEYYATLCSKPTKDEFLTSLASAYAGTLSLAQLNDAIAFYSGGVGQQLVAAHKLAANHATQIFTDAYAAQTPYAIAEFDRRLRAIAESIANRQKK